MYKNDSTSSDSISPKRQEVFIKRDNYERIFNAIIDILSEQGEIRFKDLHKVVARRIKSNLNGLIPWYTTAIKQQMEHDHIIEKVPMKAEQYLRLIGSN